MTDRDSATDQSNRTEDTDRERIEYVERTDVGVSLTVKLERGTGTRDQDEVIAKAKGSTREDAREDMDELRGYIRDLAEDARQISPTRSQTSSVPALFVVASDERRRHSTSGSNSEQAAESSSLTPEQRLEPSNVDLLRAGIETIHDTETLRAYVGCENASQQ